MTATVNEEVKNIGFVISGTLSVNSPEKFKDMLDILDVEYDSEGIDWLDDEISDSTPVQRPKKKNKKKKDSHGKKNSKGKRNAYLKAMQSSITCSGSNSNDDIAELTNKTKEVINKLSKERFVKQFRRGYAFVRLSLCFIV